MGARTRLNRAYLNGSLLIAAVIGLASDSWTTFAVALAGLVLANVVFGEIRLRRRHER